MEAMDEVYPGPEEAPSAPSDDAPAPEAAPKRDPRPRGDDGPEPHVPSATVHLSGASGSASGVIDAAVAALQKGGATPEQVSRFRSRAESDSYTDLFDTVRRWMWVR